MGGEDTTNGSIKETETLKVETEKRMKEKCVFSSSLCLYVCSYKGPTDTGCLNNICMYKKK